MKSCKWCKSVGTEKVMVLCPEFESLGAKIFYVCLCCGKVSVDASSS